MNKYFVISIFQNDAVLSGWLKKYPDVGQAKTRFFYLKKRLLVYYKEPHVCNTRYLLFY